MPSWFEFHDSYLESVRVTEKGLTFLINGYVHRWERIDGTWNGSGWYQPLRIATDKPTYGEETREHLYLDGGGVIVEGLVHDNWLPLPCSGRGDVTVWFELRENGERLDFSGRDVTVEAVGDAEFVEKLPDDLRPSELD